MNQALIIEDFLPIAKVWEGLLSEFGYDDIVILSEPTEEIIHDYIATTNLILMDVNLGNGQNGFDLSEYILAINKDIPIIFLSLENNQQVVLRAKHIGAKGYITKQLPKDLIAMGIAEILRANDQFIEVGCVS